MTRWGPLEAIRVWAMLHHFEIDAVCVQYSSPARVFIKIFVWPYLVVPRVLSWVVSCIPPLIFWTLTGLNKVLPNFPEHRETNCPDRRTKMMELPANRSCVTVKGHHPQTSVGWPHTLVRRSGRHLWLCVKEPLPFPEAPPTGQTVISNRGHRWSWRSIPI